MATVYNPRTDKTKTVKNLGWLLRHKNEVKAVEITGPNYPGTSWECHMRVVLNDRRVYETDWASKDLCFDFVANQHDFGSAAIWWFGKLLGS